MKIVIVFTIMVSVCLLTSPTFGADRVVVLPLFKASQPSAGKLVFVTNESWTGNLGGLTGADDKCNIEASERHFPGTFQALLGSDEGRPEHRSIHYPLPYLRVDGEDLNSDFHDLFNSGPDSYITAASLYPWTGLEGNGTLTVNNCNGWSDSTNSYGGTIGLSNATNGASSSEWLFSTTSACNIPRPLYCIEQ